MKHDRKVALGSGHRGGMGGRKWDENKWAVENGMKINGR